MIISDRGNGFALELLRGGLAQDGVPPGWRLPGIEAGVAALREVLSGQTVLDPSVVDALVSRRDAASIDHLTVRELEVLELIAHGLANKAVALELRITLKAVENHVTSIFRKLRLHDRPDLNPRVSAAMSYLDRSH